MWYNFGKIVEICKNLCSKQAIFGDYRKNRRNKNPFWPIGFLWSHSEKPKCSANYFGLNGVSAKKHSNFKIILKKREQKLPETNGENC